MQKFIYYNKHSKILEQKNKAEILFSRHALKDKKLTEEDIDFAIKTIRTGKIDKKKSKKRLCLKNYYKNIGKTYFIIVENHEDFIKIITVIKKKGKY